MTTATREPPNLQGPCPGAERMVWPVQTHPAQSTGPESKRNSGDGGYFSLDFSFYRTHPAQSTGPESKRNSGDGGYFSLDFSFYRTALPSKWIPPDRPVALFRY